LNIFLFIAFKRRRLSTAGQGVEWKRRERSKRSCIPIKVERGEKKSGNDCSVISRGMFEEEKQLLRSILPTSGRTAYGSVEGGRGGGKKRSIKAFPDENSVVDGRVVMPFRF